MCLWRSAPIPGMVRQSAKGRSGTAANGMVSPYAAPEGTIPLDIIGEVEQPRLHFEHTIGRAGGG